MNQPDRGPVECIVYREAGVESVFDLEEFKRTVEIDHSRYDHIVHEFHEDIRNALREVHVGGERRYRCRQVRRRSRVRIEVAQSSGEQYNEGNIEIIGKDPTTRIERFDYQQAVVGRFKPVITNDKTPAQCCDARSDILKLVPK